MIKAIETRYKGYRFRSRLEARWAVFFETLGLNWRYEAQGFEKGEHRYLPDFEIINGAGHTIFVEVKGDPDGLVKDFDRMVEVLDFGSCLPNFEDSQIHRTTALLLLGDVPEPKWGLHAHPLILHYKGLHKYWCHFHKKGIWLIDGSPLSCFCNLDPEECIEGDPSKWRVESRFVATPLAYQDVTDAYAAARSARFEHGEKP